MTLDAKVADYLKEQARLLGKPFKQVVSEPRRRGNSPGLREAPRPKFRVKAIRGGCSWGGPTEVE